MSSFGKEFDEAFDNLVELGAASLMQNSMEAYMDSEPKYKFILMRRTMDAIYRKATIDMEKWMKNNPNAVPNEYPK